jgi:hypothetical protein
MVGGKTVWDPKTIRSFGVDFVAEKRRGRREIADRENFEKQKICLERRDDGGMGWEI